MKRIAKKRGMVAVVIGVVVTIGIGLTWPRERLLPLVAHPVVHIDVEKEYMCWQSEHQLFLLKVEHGARLPGLQNGEPVYKDWKGSADLLDIRTGVRKHLSELTNLLNRTGTFPRSIYEGFNISPDGLWLLWDNDKDEMHSFCCAAHLDGTHYRKWNRSFVNYTFFLDARHLVQIPGSEINFRDLLDPPQDRENLKLEQAEALVAQYIDKHSLFVIGPPANFDETHRFLDMDTYRTQDRCRMIITESNFDYQAPASLLAPEPLLKRFVKLPEGAILYRQQESPQQHAFFFQLNCSRLPPFSAWLHRFFPKFDVQPTFTKELWISRADGHGMREIGYILTYPAKGSNVEDHFEEVQWLPNGKQISFVYHGIFYVVPADPGSGGSEAGR